MSFDRHYLDTRQKFSHFSTPSAIKLAFDSIGQPTRVDTQVTFESLGSIECADRLRFDPSTAGKNILVLNFANGELPCWDCVCGNTQEENLFRRTNLGDALKHELYPLGESLIWNQGVSIFKNNAYDMISKPWMVDMLTCAAIQGPTVAYINSRELFKKESEREATRNRIRAMLAIAAKYDIFVTGAWGCGCFTNPVNEMCDLWREEIKRCGVKHVVFTIPDHKLLNRFKKEFAN